MDRTMTLNLSELEMEELAKMAKERGLSKTALVRQSIELYQSVIERMDKGERLFIESKRSKQEILVID